MNFQQPFPRRRVTLGMEPVTSPLSRDVLDEDLQIVRVTLATIYPEICRFSEKSAKALRLAVQKIDEARAAFAEKTPEQDRAQAGGELGLPASL